MWQWHVPFVCNIGVNVNSSLMRDVQTLHAPLLMILDGFSVLEEGDIVLIHAQQGANVFTKGAVCEVYDDLEAFLLSFDFCVVQNDINILIEIKKGRISPFCIKVLYALLFPGWITWYGGFQKINSFFKPHIC